MDNESTVWLNGAWLPAHQATISPLDRGFLYGDAVYEVVPTVSGKPVMVDAHLARLESSMDAVGIRNPYQREAWADIVQQLALRNPTPSGRHAIYLQISRGTASTRTRFITPDLEPTVFGMACPIERSAGDTGSAAVTMPDLRWQRCDIKSTSLLANVLMFRDADAQHADEAILLRDGYVTEGIFSSVLILEGTTLIGRPQGNELLPGTTLNAVIELAPSAGLHYSAELVTEARLEKADEIWLMSATRDIVPVTRLNNKAVGSGKPGPFWLKLNQLFMDWKKSQV